MGSLARDFTLTGLIRWRSKRAQAKKVAQLDAYYSALLEADQAEAAQTSDQA